MPNTPRVGVNGAIFDEQGLMLLEKREYDATTGIPGGWVDWGESPEEAIKREILEETGLIVDIQNFVGIFTRKPGMFDSEHSSIHILYICKVIKGDLKKSDESLEIGYWDHKQVNNWHKDHGKMSEAVNSYRIKL